MMHHGSTEWDHLQSASKGRESNNASLEKTEPKGGKVLAVWAKGLFGSTNVVTAPAHKKFP